MLGTLATVFLMKFTDCALGTLKTVYLYKNKFFVSSVLNSLSAALFIFVADAMANSPDNMKMIIAGIVFTANLTGSYIPPKFLERIEDDKLFIYNITTPSLEEGFNFADKIRELGIGITTDTGRDKYHNKVLKCSCYSINKNQSSAIENLLNDTYKWHVVTATFADNNKNN